MNSNSRLFIYGETAVFCLIFLYAGLHFRPADPFLLFSAYQVYIPFTLVLTLAGGTGAGLIALVFAAALAHFYYTPYPYQPLLWTALITLATGEFKIYWDRKIHMYTEERDYFREKLRDLTRNFILMKMSHERLEKNYILRPVSIRSSLEEIRTLLLKHEGEACQSLMDFMANFYGLESAALFIRRTEAAAKPSGRLAWLFKDKPGVSWQEAGKTGLGAQLDLTDPLIGLALGKREAAYFTTSQLKNESKSAYIAVIPYFYYEGEEPQAILAIKDIPFLQLNRDNLITLAMYLSFFMGEFVDTERFSTAAEAFPKLDSDIFKELARLQKMRRDFGVDSILIRFQARYGDISKEVSSFIESEIRGFDLSYSGCDEHCVVLVILPLTGYANAAIFTSRVEEKVKNNFASFKGTLEKKVLPITGDEVLPLLNQAMSQ
ncbi:MAG: PelD GGDEF domain-containing protein [Elusimicrobiales bacterium]